MENFNIQLEPLIKGLITELALLKTEITETKSMLTAYMKAKGDDEVLTLFEQSLNDSTARQKAALLSLFDRLSTESDEMKVFLKDLFD